MRRFPVQAWVPTWSEMTLKIIAHNQEKSICDDESTLALKNMTSPKQRCQWPHKMVLKAIDRVILSPQQRYQWHHKMEKIPYLGLPSGASGLSFFDVSPLGSETEMWISCELFGLYRFHVQIQWIQTISLKLVYMRIRSFKRKTNWSPQKIQDIIITYFTIYYCRIY